MMEVLKYVVTAVSGYIFGSVSFSVLISTIFHKSDVRSSGSGNAGATNMARSYGIWAGLETMLGDMLKTILALLCGYFILGRVGFSIAGATCLLGHCYPVFYEFKGGKGVSAGAILALAIHPLLFAAVVAVFLIMAFLTKKVSVGSLSGALAMAAGAVISGQPPEFIALAVFTCLIVFIRHSANIKRLVKGEEPDFKPAKLHKK